ncbi:cyclase family protein [Longivirga aurantiaca]|uniref:Cyclase family protein n=1 Tax=Longivirga aurantiaca TaxID=1837743 RepID=A0ABW1T4K0_9ACTN
MTTSTTGNWGRWGADDERGALNHLSAETVLAAAQSIRTGRVYQLGTVLHREGLPTLAHRGVPRRFTLLNHSDRGWFEGIGAPPELGWSEDVIMLATHSGTHLDALCHVDHGGEMYNGYPKEGFTSLDGAAKCGIEKTGAFAARGVLVDVAAHKGVPLLPPVAITLEDFLETLEAQGSDVRPGDVVAVRTGWLEHCLASGGELEFEQPGIGLDVARWLAEHDVTAVGADNSSVEVMPWDGDEFLGTHLELLVRHGIYLMEHLWLQELSQDRRYDFLFCVSPLLVKGATGSPVNPIAIG